ncbi:MAG: cytochrome c oxidase subunit II [Thermomicrobiales bacterium]|nr:cytochrome c oxidase subunit II [Thermomicrobiales bacterium]
MLSIPRIKPEAEVAERANRLRRQLIIPATAPFLILFIFAIYWAPFPEFRAQSIGKPEVTVNVDSLQWAWIMDAQEVPAHKVVEFNVTSRDVNHGFAIYNPEGRLVTQTQAMPTYTNKLIYKFDEPGVYTVRCLEYCGIGHHIMLGSFTVA